MLCSEKLNKELKALIYFPFHGDDKAISDYLKEGGFTLKKRLQLQSYFRQKNNNNIQKKQVISLIKLAREDKYFEDIQFRESFLRDIKGLKYSLWSQLLKLKIAIHAKNFLWVDKLKKEILKMSPYSLYVKSHSFSEDEEQVVKDFLIKVLDSYRKLPGNLENSKLIGKYLSRVLEQKDLGFLEKRYNADWSLSEIRNKMKNPIHQYDFFDFWFFLLMNRSSDLDVKSRIRDFLNQSILSHAEDGQFWIFEYFFPGGTELRSLLKTRLLEMWQKGDLVSKYTVLRVLLNNKAKSFLSKQDRVFQRGDFQLRREYFKELLNTGESTTFAFYNLIKLGNRDQNDLWWLIM